MTDNEKQAINMIANEVKKVNDIMLKNFEKFCADSQGKAVPIVFIREAYRQFEVNYNKAINDRTTESPS
jgi:hypothetical protein